MTEVAGATVVLALVRNGTALVGLPTLGEGFVVVPVAGEATVVVVLDGTGPPGDVPVPRVLAVVPLAGGAGELLDVEPLGVEEGPCEVLV